MKSQSKCYQKSVLLKNFPIKVAYAAIKTMIKKRNFAANTEATSFVTESNLNPSVSDLKDWVFDTAASTENFLITLNQFSKEITVAVGYTTYFIEGEGNIDLKFESGTVTLLNGMYSLRLNKNLIFGTKFDNANAKFIVEKGQIKFYTPSGQKLFTAKKQNGLIKYFPKVKAKNVKSRKLLTVSCQKIKQSNFKTWPKKFCHINSKYLIKIIL